MNRYEIFEKLNVKPAGIFISKIEIASWGQELILSCLYNPPDEDKLFQVHFKQCEKIHWEMMDPDANLQREVVADVLGFDLGQDRYLEDAIIHTTDFEIGVVYREVIVQKQWTD